MYTIVGADGAEYGPVTEGQIRSWMAAKRADLLTRARREGETEWKALGDFPEFSGGVRDPFQPPPVPVRGEIPEGGSAREITEAILQRGGRIEIGSSFERAWEVLKKRFWPILGVTVLLMAIQFGIQQVLTRGIAVPDLKSGDDDVIAAASQLSTTFAIILPVLTVIQVLFSAGLQYFYVKNLRGETATLGDAFKGFTRAAPLILAAIAMMFLIWIGFFILIIPGLYLLVAYSYAPLLIVDQKLPAMKAMEVSRRLVTRQWFTLFGMMLLSLLLLLAGVCALIVGILVAMPLVGLAMVAAYESLVNPKGGS